MEPKVAGQAPNFPINSGRFLDSIHLFLLYFEKYGEHTNSIGIGLVILKWIEEAIKFRKLTVYRLFSFLSI